MTKELLPDFIAVEVPEDARIDNFKAPVITNIHGDNDFVWPSIGGWVVYLDTLPPGNWTFLFCTADASEEQAAQVVEKDRDSDVEGEPPYSRFIWWDVFKNYESGDFEFDTAKESLQSLLDSKGLKGNWAVLKKIN